MKHSVVLEPRNRQGKTWSTSPELGLRPEFFCVNFGFRKAELFEKPSRQGTGMDREKAVVFLVFSVLFFLT